MSPKPQGLCTQQKRLPVREEFVTICAAAINRKSPTSPAIINIAFDQKLSLAGGVISADGSIWKLRKLNSKWCVMFAGDTSSLFALREAVIEVAQYESKVRVLTFARSCSKAFREERKSLIETDILAKYDIESYSEYLKLKDEDRKFFDSITKEIEKAEEDWSLLFAGFDDLDEPHIFVISGFGKFQYCDLDGFACIGSGMWPAYASLAAYSYNIYLPEGEAIYSLLTAKFAAETADGVGQTSVFLSFRANDRNRSVPGLRPEAIQRLREEWKSLPKIPEGISAELERDSQAAAKAGFRLSLPKARRHRRRPKQ